MAAVTNSTLPSRLWWTGVASRGSTHAPTGVVSAQEGGVLETKPLTFSARRDLTAGAGVVGFVCIDWGDCCMRSFFE